jgi:hypothetical protein
VPALLSAAGFCLYGPQALLALITPATPTTRAIQGFQRAGPGR